MFIKGNRRMTEAKDIPHEVIQLVLMLGLQSICCFTSELLQGTKLPGSLVVLQGTKLPGSLVVRLRLLVKVLLCRTSRPSRPLSRTPNLCNCMCKNYVVSCIDCNTIRQSPSSMSTTDAAVDILWPLGLSIKQKACFTSCSSSYEMHAAKQICVHECYG